MTRIRLLDTEAEWNNDRRLWSCADPDVANVLNRTYRRSAPFYSPFPAGDAVDFAKELFPNLEILEMDQKPTAKEGVVY